MKVKVGVGVLLLFALVMFAMPVMALRSSSTSSTTKKAQRNRHHNKQGAEVGNRVRQLRRFNRSVDRALTAFERNEHRNGHKPRLDDSSSLTVDPSGGSAALKNVMDASPFRKAAFKPQDEDFTDYGFEVIVIPVYASATEWQGTVIFNTFDPSGNYLGQYVADVIIGPDATQTLLDVGLEISFEGEQAYLECGNASAYWNLGDPGAGDPGHISPILSSIGRTVTFEKAAFTPQLNPFTLGQRIGGAHPRVRQYVRCSWGAGAAVGIGCGVAALALTVASIPPCLVSGVSLGNAGCGIAAIFGIG